MMHPYMRRRQGREAVTYPHPSLEPVLKRTLGVPLFQEQLLRIAMTVANFTGAEAEELRRAVGMRRSWQRMKDLEVKLRAGMTTNGLASKTQDEIVQAISSFALYGFPESHAASFALLAYASAYFKVKYLAAFTAAILNNQPMGFYAPAVLVKDAQRHGLKVRPIDVQVSDWPCTVEHELSSRREFVTKGVTNVANFKKELSSRADPSRSEGGVEGPAFRNADSTSNLSLRLGLGYARGLREETGKTIVESRRTGGPFRSADDLALRVPTLNKKEITLLANIGALNNVAGIGHRRDALWQVERAGKPEGPLLTHTGALLADGPDPSPLAQMTPEERLVADYSGTGLTTGRHPMAYRREELRRQNVLTAQDLRTHRDGEWVRAAGCVIARQRPGTAKGFVFLSMEDETGIANVIVTPQMYESNQVTVTRSRFLLVEGPLQNQDNVVHVKAARLTPLDDKAVEIRSHDFH
jgi:error-prone DNA polymerase